MIRPFKLKLVLRVEFLLDALLKLQRLEPIQGYEGIFNGTSNYILDQMTKNALDYEVALKMHRTLDMLKKILRMMWKELMFTIRLLYLICWLIKTKIRAAKTCWYF